MTSSSQLGSTSITLQFDLDRNIGCGGARRAGGDQCRGGAVAYGSAEPSPHTRLTNPSGYARAVPGHDFGHSSHRACLRYCGLDRRAEDFAGGRRGAKWTIGGSGAARGSRGPELRWRSGALWDNRAGGCSRGIARRRMQILPKDRCRRDQSDRWVVSDSDQLFDADQYAPLIVAYRSGAPVRLGDVARVSDGIEDFRNIGIRRR